MPKGMTSYIKTTTATDTRAADTLSFPFPFRPQSMTIYVRFIEREPTTFAATNPRVVQIGDGSNNTPRLDIRKVASGSDYQVLFHNGTGSVTSNVTAGQKIGSRVELRATISATGVVRLHYSLDGGTEASGTASSAIAMPQAWSGTSLWVSTNNVSAIGAIWLRNLCIARGSQSMATMRRLARVKR